jgi:hypothetical protein
MAYIDVIYYSAKYGIAATLLAPGLVVEDAEAPYFYTFNSLLDAPFHDLGFAGQSSSAVMIQVFVADRDHVNLFIDLLIGQVTVRSERVHQQLRSVSSRQQKA